MSFKPIGNPFSTIPGQEGILGDEKQNERLVPTERKDLSEFSKALRYFFSRSNLTMDAFSIVLSEKLGERFSGVNISQWVNGSTPAKERIPTILNAAAHIAFDPLIAGSYIESNITISLQTINKAIKDWINQGVPEDQIAKLIGVKPKALTLIATGQLSVTQVDWLRYTAKIDQYLSLNSASKISSDSNLESLKSLHVEDEIGNVSLERIRYCLSEWDRLGISESMLPAITKKKPGELKRIFEGTLTCTNIDWNNIVKKISDFHFRSAKSTEIANLKELNPVLRKLKTELINAIERELQMSSSSIIDVVTSQGGIHATAVNVARFLRQ